MLLYRAQSMPSGLRSRTAIANDPATRASGRWFTDDLEAAYRMLDDIPDHGQIVCIEIADAVAESFRVSNTPVTTCGLTPCDHSATPDRDFLIPRFFAVQAEEIEAVASDIQGEVVTMDFLQRYEIGHIQAVG